MKENIQMTAEDLANLCLGADEYHGYTDEDLVNATLIFLHIFIDVLYGTLNGMTLKEQCEKAQEAGEKLRNLILETTGKDMHKLFTKV